MNISQLFSWPLVNWPSTTPAAKYAVFQLYPTGVNTPIATATTNSASLSFDDTQAFVYQVRPCDTSVVTFGPEVTTLVVNYVPCRGWVKQKVRQAIADRADQGTAPINWPEDELLTWFNEGLAELNQEFPFEEDAPPIAMLPPTIVNGVQTGVRDYALPTDLYLMKEALYINADGTYRLYLKEKPFKGGETTATTYLGYPKLGILYIPLSGRFYGGHYDIFEGQIHLDWDPKGDGDTLKIRYYGRRPFPTGDGDIMAVPPEYMRAVSLYVEWRCWLRVEGQDTRLSRWRTKDDGGSRGDMSTLRHSVQVRSLYNESVNNLRELRPRVLRLVRR